MSPVKEIDKIKNQAKIDEKTSFIRGQEAGKNEIYNKEIKRILKRNKIIRNIIFWSAICTALIALILLIIAFFDDKWDGLFKKIVDKSFLIDLGISLLLWIIDAITKKTNLLTLDSDIIKEKVINKYK